jgi:hypothetical protein
MDPSIEQALAARDRYRRAINARRTPQERLAAMKALQDRAWRAMSPAGRDHFIQRNRRLRAIDVSQYEPR